jgi:hypothetical protein
MQVDVKEENICAVATEERPLRNRQITTTN